MAVSVIGIGKITILYSHAFRARFTNDVCMFIIVYVIDKNAIIVLRSYNCDVQIISTKVGDLTKTNDVYFSSNVVYAGPAYLHLSRQV